MESIEIPRDTGARDPEAVARPLAIALTLMAGVLRLVGMPANFAPVGAIGLFGGARLRSWQAFVLPLAVMLGTNGALAALHGSRYFFYPSMPFVYGSFLVYVLIGRALRQTESPWWIGAGSLAGSLQFFLITNFGQWLTMGVPAGSSIVLEPGQYYWTPAGLFECYVQGLPFFGRTVLSDLAFTAGFIGLHAFITRAYFITERVPVRRNSP
jgi:hypothetical protein